MPTEKGQNRFMIFLQLIPKLLVMMYVNNKPVKT
jgi:hypothetical protein